MRYEHLETRLEGQVAHVILNRSDVRNAFNGRLVSELADWAATVREDGSVRVAVISGRGPVFCAGGDLTWVADSIGFTAADNLKDAQAVAAVLEAFDTLPMPLVGRIHGAAIGGGAGLVAVCDIAVADEQAVFGFPEVRHGLLPSVITPYVLAKIGRSAARELFLTGARFSAARAKEIGLVHSVVPIARLDAAVDAYVQELLSGGPNAVAGAKAMIARVSALPPSEAGALTAASFAACRVSDEAQEGMRAFLEKRKPRWR